MSHPPESKWPLVFSEDLTFLNEHDQWYKTEYCHKYPHMRQIVPADVLLGHMPPERFIRRDTKVLALGSCFAEYFITLLAREGYNDWRLPSERHSWGAEDPLIFFWSTFENIFVVLQQFRWAFEEFRPQSRLWFTKDKKLFEATEDRRTRVRYAFENAEVFVITLGLSEVWFDVIEN